MSNFYHQDVFFVTILRLEAVDDEVRVVCSVDLSCIVLLLLLKLYDKLLVPLELRSLPLNGCAIFRLCLNRQYDEFVDFNFDINSSLDSLLNSPEQSPMQIFTKRKKI